MQEVSLRYCHRCISLILSTIQLLESPIPTLSQKASSGDISGTKRGIIDPLGQNSEIWSTFLNLVKILKFGQNSEIWSKF